MSTQQQNFNVQLIPSDDKELINILKKIEKKSTSTSGYVADQVQLLKETAYLNASQKITSKMISEELSLSESEIKEVKMVRLALLAEVYENTKTAFEDSFLDAADFMDLEQLIFSIKEQEVG